MLKTIKTICMFIVALMAASILGCSSGPSEDTIVGLVRERLKQNVPVETVEGQFMTRAKTIDEIRVLTIGEIEERQDNTSGVTIQFCKCNVYMRGKSVDQAFGKYEYAFDGEHEYKIYKDPQDSKWKIEKGFLY